MIEDELRDSKTTIISICEHRKQTLIKLLELVDMYAHGSLAPEEFYNYEKTKNILIERHSQHEK